MRCPFAYARPLSEPPPPPPPCSFWRLSARPSASSRRYISCCSSRRSLASSIERIARLRPCGSAVRGARVASGACRHAGCVRHAWRRTRAGRGADRVHLLSLFLPGIAQRPAQLQRLAALGTEGPPLHRLHDELRRASRLECHIAAARLVVHPRAHHLAPLPKAVERGPDLSLRPSCRQASHKDRCGLSAVAHAAEHITVDTIRRVDKPLFLCHVRQAMK